MKIKKLQLITALLFILTILIMSTGLTLIDFSNYHSNMFNLLTKSYEKLEKNGFELLKTISINHILSYSADYVCHISHNNKNYYNWIQLQVGIIFCIIITPILTFITTSLLFFNIGLRVKIKNNNFWDAIQNCEIISNYYIH
ncbi:hypothetical protein [Spiroplasma endosymbiont of Amphimallon solstitiale]|uniref:hypothetical protein n=1 Tax=Spiroplasma endosymbiont of Amphimallon solstitiale TaxID=3066288 RepID=UPI00313B7990